MDEIEEVNHDIDTGNKREKFNFSIFSMPLNFLSNIYNGKISLKDAELGKEI